LYRLLSASWFNETRDRHFPFYRFFIQVSISMLNIDAPQSMVDISTPELYEAARGSELRPAGEKRVDDGTRFLLYS